MRVLITGATGIIGRKLIAELKQSKTRPSKSIEYQLRILIQKDQNNNFKDGDTELVRGDLLDLNSLHQATQNIDVAIHLAGITHTNQQNLYYEVNTLGTENLLKVCRNNKVRKFIYISSRAASQDGGAYARSKLLAEKKVEQSQLNWIILSLAEVYGAGKKEAVSRLINLMRKSYFIPIIGNGQYLLSPVFVDDVVDGIIKAIEKDNVFRKKYILAGPEEFTYNEMINRLSEILKVSRFKIYLPLFLVKLLIFILNIFKKDMFVRDQLPRLLCEKSANIALAKRDLDFNTREFEVGVRGILNNSYY